MAQQPRLLVTDYWPLILKKAAPFLGPHSKEARR